MDKIPAHKFLQMNPNTLEEVRRDVNMHRPGEMKEAVGILHEWIQQQPHFKKKDFPLHFLELLILMAKGSIEKAKKNIDCICTIKTIIPQWFGTYNPKVDFCHTWEKSYCAVPSKLTSDNYRLFILKLVGKYDNTKSLDVLFKYTLYFLEHFLLYDYGSGIVIIYDLLEADLLNTLKNVNLLDLKKYFIVILESYNIRLKRFHIISTSKTVETFIKFFKPFIKVKLMDRIIVHKSSEELHAYYSNDILPKDYGGTQNSVSEIHEKCIDILSTKEYMKMGESMLEARVDESLRPLGQFGEMYAGTVGSFRSLNVD